MSEEPDYSTLPLEERLVHKLWKARLEAYQEITNNFQKTPNEESEVFRPFLTHPDTFKKIVTDSNVVAQESGITALNALLEFGGFNAAIRLRTAVVPALCEKGLSSSRAGTKQKTIEALLWFIDLDTPDPVIELMVPSLTVKLPKLVSGTVKALVDIYTDFGAKVVSPKLVLPLLPKLFSHADRTVRAETSNLTVELYKWMGPALEQVLFSDLKPVQQKDLTAAFEKVKDEKPTQLRFLKSQRDAMEHEQTSGQDSNPQGDEDVVMGDSDEPQDLDPYDLMDPTDVLSKIPQDLSAKVSVTKWKERVEALTEVDEVLKKVIKLADGDYTDLLRTLAKCVKDVNVQVVTLAANCIEYITKGLRQRFQRYHTIVLNPLLERLKEKKQSVVDALNCALDATFQSSSLSDVLEETLAALKHKTPQVRLASSQFLTRCLKETAVPPNRSEVESIITTAIKLVGDTLADVRTSAFQVVGTLMKITGERELNSYLEAVDDIKKKKIQEAFEVAEVKAKASAPKPKPKAKSAPTPAPTTRVAPRTSAPARGSSSIGTSLTSSSASSSAAAAKRKSIPRPLASSTSSSSLTSLKNKLPAQSTIPSKRPPTSPLKSEALPRSSLNRGLTGRQLQSSAPPPQPVQQIQGNGLNEAEREELEELRRERAKWQQEREKMNWQMKDAMNEGARFMQEIQTLQLRVDKLSSQHTEDIMTIKSKDTQLQRYQSDLEISRMKISQLESEVELLQKQRSSALYSSNSHSTFTQSSFSNNTTSTSRFVPLQESNNIRDEPQSNPFIDSASSLEHLDQRVGTLTIEPEQKGNNHAFEPLHPQTISANSANGYSPVRTTARLDSNDESWKRAALVTSELKARIEEMKSRNRKSRMTLGRGDI